jgi:hypothetical protein
VGGKSGREYWSLEWIHRVREEHYRRTKDLPLEACFHPIDPEKTARASRRLGLKVKLARVAVHGRFDARLWLSRVASGAYTKSRGTHGNE